MAKNIGKELLVFLYYILKFPFIVIIQIVGHFWRPKKDVSNDTVLVTGAGSGLGRLVARRFAALGSKVILWDINEDAIKTVAREIKSEFDGTAITYKIDLSKREDVNAVAEKVKKEVGDVDILVNNAGIVTGKKLLDAPDEKIELTMKVNTMANFWTAKAFLPAMIEKNRGHVVTIASSAGHVGVAGLCDYCASKFGAVGFNESLRFELRKTKKTGVKTTCVCPFYIDTGMFDGAQTKWPWILPVLQPDYVADKILSAILTDQEELFLPRFLYLTHFFRGILPISCFDEITEWFGASDTMDDFRGRADN